MTGGNDSGAAYHPAVADEYRKFHDLTCPARDVTAVPDELIEQECRCPQDGRWLNPQAHPVPEPDAPPVT